MSLINEALKKAQRVRTEEPGDPAAPVQPAAGNSARIAKRGKATSANTMVLIGSGALVLVVLSVVLTVFLVNRPSAPAPKSASAAPVAPLPAPAPPPAETPAPVLVTPALTPAVSPSPAETGATAGTSPSVPPTAPTTPAASAPAAPAPSAEPPATPPIVAATPAPAPAAIVPATPPPPAAPDERITAFVEAIKVAGIRSSGNESRVLMNDRVFRVNDIVDRTLGVRLIKVDTDHLTFADARGATYVKNF